MPSSPPPTPPAPPTHPTPPTHRPRHLSCENCTPSISNPSCSSSCPSRLFVTLAYLSTFSRVSSRLNFRPLVQFSPVFIVGGNLSIGKGSLGPQSSRPRSSPCEPPVSLLPAGWALPGPVICHLWCTLHIATEKMTSMMEKNSL